MTRSKLVKDRAVASERRIGKHVITAFGQTKSRKLVKTLETLGKAVENGWQPSYMVMADTQGVGYLRVEATDRGARFLLNTGKTIEVVEVDEKTIKNRQIREVPGASIVDAAKVLAQPLTSGVIISKRAKFYLDKIQNDKEIQNMATKKAVTTKAKATTKATKEPKTPKLVQFKKMAKEEDLPKQAFAILQVIKAKGKIAVADLVKAIEGKITTKQPVNIIWSFYRSKLIKGGYIAVA